MLLCPVEMPPEMHNALLELVLSMLLNGHLLGQFTRDNGISTKKLRVRSYSMVLAGRQHFGVVVKTVLHSKLGSVVGSGLMQILCSVVRRSSVLWFGGAPSGGSQLGRRMVLNYTLTSCMCLQPKRAKPWLLPAPPSPFPLASANVFNCSRLVWSQRAVEGAGLCLHHTFSLCQCVLAGSSPDSSYKCSV